MFFVIFGTLVSGRIPRSLVSIQAFWGLSQLPQAFFPAENIVFGKSKLFLACRSCRKRLSPRQKQVFGFGEVSLGRNGGYSSIFPHIPSDFRSLVSGRTPRSPFLDQAGESAGQVWGNRPGRGAYTE